jgi:hypothetical protein
MSTSLVVRDNVSEKVGRTIICEFAESSFMFLQTLGAR